MTDTRYYRISPKFWRHGMAHHWTDRDRVLALYLLTCPHRNIAGFYVLPKPYVLADLEWDEKTLDAAWERLLAEDFMRYDDMAQVVFVVKALQYDAPENANQRKAAIKYLHEVPFSPLWQALLEVAQANAEPFADDVRQLVAKRFGEPLPKPLPEQLSEPLPEPIPKLNANTVSVSVTVPVTVKEDDDNARVREASVEKFSAEDITVLAKAWRTHMSGDLSPYYLDKLAIYRETTGPPLDVAVIIWAMEQAAHYEKRTWAYLDSILRNTQQKGLTHLADIQTYEQQRKDRGTRDSIPRSALAGRHDDSDSLDALIQRADP